MLSCAELSIFEDISILWRVKRIETSPSLSKGIQAVELILYIFAKTVQLTLSGVSLCMFFTVILQFFVNPEESRAYRFFGTVSEIFVMPFRVILAKLNLFQGIPIDMPFMIAYLSISLISMLLPVI